MIPFYIVDPELAARETRVVNVLVPHKGVLAGSYGLLELYCPDPTCHCRRVMLSIREAQNPEHVAASINYGFDRDDEMAGPFLDPLNPQGRYAEALLELITVTALEDSQYVCRLERHYGLVKQAAADPQHPAYQELKSVLTDEAVSFPLLRPERKAPKAPSKAKRTGKRRKR